MFIGHFGVGFGAKAGAPRMSLGTLLLAAQFVDLLWPTFLLFGLEYVEIQPGITRVTPLNFVFYPLSHSLTFGLVWALLFAAIYWLIRRYVTGALVAAGCVISHWLLDLIVHRPDLPLTLQNDVKVGLGLWSSLPATMILEFALFGFGLALYLRSTMAKDRKGTVGLWGLVHFLAGLYLANLFGPPPPSPLAIAWVGQAQWLIIFFAYWVDRHRCLRRSVGQ
jgi:hypothetical protein